MTNKKSRFTQTWEDDNEESWLVSYYYEGKYYPQTLEEPAEYPTLEIDSIISEVDGRDFGEPTETLIDYIKENHDGGDDDHGDFYGN